MATRTRTIIDDNGFEWRFNGRRVYMVEAEKEFRRDGIPVSENGYPCNSFEEAIEILKDGGYISESPLDSK